MVPRDVEIMIEAKQAERDRNWQRADALNGQLCAIMAEPYRDRDKHPDPFTASDFILFREPEPELTTPEEPQGMTEEQVRKSISVMKMWVSATGGRNG